MLSFPLSYGFLCLVQGAVVALPAAIALGPLRRLRSGWWALIPAASIVGVIAAIGAASQVADGLTDLALVAVPILAALALGWAMRGGRWWLVPIAGGLFALALADRGALAGEAGAVALSALSCVALGALLAAVAPGGWLKLGVLAMAAVDVYLVVSQELQAPNQTLNVALPSAGLPALRLQREAFGSALMGYGDLFVAGVLGGILARGGRSRLGAGALTAALGMLFGLLFFVVGTLPATVPVAVALLIGEPRRSFRRPHRGCWWCPRWRGRWPRRVHRCGERAA